MTSRGTRVGLAALAVVIVALPAATPAGAAKKGGGTVNITSTNDEVIPDRGPGPGAPWGQLVTTIDVGKRFKGLRIRDVDVTVETTGAGVSAAQDLLARLTAPNGATSRLFQMLIGFSPPNNSIGPLTLDDEAPLGIGFLAPIDAHSLFQPWAGTARPLGNLFVMDGGPVTGDWTLRVFDTDDTDLSVLSSWRLRVTAGKPFVTK
jgi:hypothetical protein